MAAGPRHFSIFDAPFWQSAAEGALRLQRCTQCERWRFPPGAACPRCLSTEAEWVAVSGTGTLLSWTTFHRQYLPAYPAPTTCVAVQLSEGPILIGNIDQEEVGALQADMPVFLAYGRHPDGYVLPRFSIDPEKAKRPVPPAVAAAPEAAAAPRAPAKAARKAAPRAMAPAKRSAAKAKPSKAKSKTASARKAAAKKTAAKKTIVKKVVPRKAAAKKAAAKTSGKAKPAVTRARPKGRKGRKARA